MWKGMLYRCSNKESPSYANYDGRGIAVCKEWKDSFVAFRNWAANNGYTDSLHIDRIDNYRGYSPDNCRFVTPKENCRNKRYHRRITVAGKTKILAEWCEEYGINRGQFIYWINRGLDPAGVLVCLLDYKEHINQLQNNDSTL